MQNKRLMLVVPIIAIVVITLLPVPPVLGYQKEEVLLGSGVDPTTFEYNGHTIAEGFAADISMDLPVPKKTTTQSKVGFAVAGLGDPWVESGINFYFEFTPYVKETWLEVEGDGDYTVYPGSIFDNTGTGPESMQFLEIILFGLDLAFLGYDIYSLLQEVWEEPPVEEWQHDGHWAKAISQQRTEPGFYPWQKYVDPDDPRLQTAGANVLSHFDEAGPQTLTIIAQAEIYVQITDWVNLMIVHHYIGTYSVSFQVSVPVGVYDLSVRTYLTTGEDIHDVKVWIDDEPERYSWVTTEVGYGTHTIEVESTFCRDRYEYTFQYWEGGATINPRTENVVNDITLRAYYQATFINSPPNTPSTPSGPTTVYRNVWYTYSTCATDPDEDSIRYHLNATGPGNPYQNTTIWVDSDTPMIWNLLWEPTDSPGTYLIQTWVEDIYGALSPMSSLSVVMVNRPPNTPSTPSGPSSGYTYTSYSYSTSTTDSDGDNVRYEFDWDDGSTTTGWYSSDQTASASHSWSSSGIYYVKVRAQDSYGTWSGWSSSRTVEITIKLVDLVIRVPQAPPEGVKIWVDGNLYTAYENSPVSITVGAGQHTIEAERSFFKEGWIPGMYFIYTFDHWSDGSEASPRTITLTSDKTLTAYYLRSKYGILAY